MPSRCATIEVYPEYNKDGSVNYKLPFSYGCPEFGLMGYSKVERLALDIRYKLMLSSKKILNKKENQEMDEIMKLNGDFALIMHEQRLKGIEQAEQHFKKIIEEELCCEEDYEKDCVLCNVRKRILNKLKENKGK